MDIVKRKKERQENIRFLRYPGGKAKLLSEIAKYLPDPNSIEGKYLEPFVGGGSVYLFLQPKQAILSDLNKELIDLYKGIRNYPHKIWKIYSSFPSGKESYYQIRNEQSSDKPIWYRAAKTLFLNRTCFKGMWRHNLNGEFNVGYGGEERRWVISHENIIELSKMLRKATVETHDFKKALNTVEDGDFVFLDPPYKPAAREMDHAHYINGKFSFKDQERLANTLKSVSKRKDVKWVMTNSSHEDIRNLYSEFNIVDVKIGTSNKVGIMEEYNGEVLISNY